MDIADFRRGRGYPGPLELPDFTALPMNLGAHSLDFITNIHLPVFSSER
jgi:hypothetical protein